MGIQLCFFFFGVCAIDGVRLCSLMGLAIRWLMASKYHQTTHGGSWFTCGACLRLDDMRFASFRSSESASQASLLLTIAQNKKKLHIEN